MKTDGIASAAYALRYWERRQEVAAHNLANVNTNGFKGERVFARLVSQGLPVAEATTDFTEGTFTPTGNPLDLALRGPHYLVVQTDNGERWSRGGSLSVDPKGFLTDGQGQQLLGEKGPVRVAGQSVEIDRSGWVIVDRVRIDRLRVEMSAPNATLQHEGGMRFVPDAGRATVAYDARTLMQGQLEGSNVNTLSSMVDMISIQRHFANAQKVLAALDGIRGTISNELGKVSG
jgi:flagellar basal-body rod protein FlgF